MPPWKSTRHILEERLTDHVIIFDPFFGEKLQCASWHFNDDLDKIQLHWLSSLPHGPDINPMDRPYLRVDQLWVCENGRLHRIQSLSTISLGGGNRPLTILMLLYLFKVRECFNFFFIVVNCLYSYYHKNRVLLKNVVSLRMKRWVWIKKTHLHHRIML